MSHIKSIKIVVYYKGQLGELAEFMDFYINGNYASAYDFLKKINPAASISDILEINTNALIYLEEIKKSGIV